MFAVGQKIWHRATGRSFTVLECYGGQVCVQQDNGAETDFAAADLTSEPPAQIGGVAARTREAQAAPGGARIIPARALTMRDITPDHERVLRIIPVRTIQAVAALYERAPGAGRFSALDTAGKLNVVAAITLVPYPTMLRYSDSPGELGLLMGKGLADSGKAPAA